MFLLIAISLFNPMLKFSCLHLAPHINPFLSSFHCRDLKQTINLLFFFLLVCVFFYPSWISDSKLLLFFFFFFHKPDVCPTGNHFEPHPHPLDLMYKLNSQTSFPTMHVRPIWAPTLNISPPRRTTEACCHLADPWSGQMKGRRGGGGLKGGKETWAKVKKANLFPASPAVPERQTTHCPYERGFNVVKGA